MVIQSLFLMSLVTYSILPRKKKQEKLPEDDDETEVEIVAPPYDPMVGVDVEYRR